MATERPVGKAWGPGRSAVRGAAWLAAAAAWTAASLFAAVLAIVFAATLAMIAVAAAGFMVIAAVALRARRAARASPADPDLIEAHHVGGHSWVAYGWDGRS